MNIIYKKADENDVYGVEYVSAHSWKETYSGLLPDEWLNKRIENIDKNIENTKNFLQNFDGKYIVAKDNDKVVGILTYGPSKDERYNDYGHLEAIYVLKEYQGYGIGKELFKLAVNRLKEMGYSKMKLECMIGNDTLNFYKKYLGEVSETIDYQINGIGTVKADILVFDDLNKVLEKIDNCLILDNFVLYEYDFNNQEHINLKNELINSEGSELISRDIDNYIRRNYEFNKNDKITNTYVIKFNNVLIGLAFVNYHPEEERENVILEEEIEIGAGLLPIFRGKHLGTRLERELSIKLLEKYPRFSTIVARIGSDNIKSIKTAKNAGFEHISDDEYHFKR